MPFKFATEIEDEDLKKVHPWKVLIVDDDLSIHEITKLSLKKFIFENREIEYYDAFSGKEAIEILKENPDVDLVLLDVVMDTDDDGLKAAKFIREDMNNKSVRIVLRTGQPGSAPEKDVILEYDIDDYKEKTELTSTKLFTTIVSSLRTSRHIKTIEKNRKGLLKIIEASRTIFKVDSLLQFTNGALDQLTSILNIEESSLFKCKSSDSFFAVLKDDQFSMLASNGKFQDEEHGAHVMPDTLQHLNKAYYGKKSFFDDDIFVGFFESNDENMIFLYIEGCKYLNDEDKNFLEVFTQNIAIAFENICLNEEVISTQKEIIERLGGIVETRSKEAALHVNRVAEISYLLANAYGLSKEEAFKIKLASPMHDIGKIGIPDSILLKPASLTTQEFDIMKTHSVIGHDILDGSNRELLRIAKVIAYEHHEKWDGSGYPQGLKEEEISIYGRIVAIADVFDALTQERPYKNAWSIEKTLTHIKEQSGKHFEPKLVELLLENIEKIKQTMLLFAQNEK